VPKRLYLHLSSAYLVCNAKGLRLQLVAEGNVLSYCGGWRALKTKPFLFHMKHRGWKRFYWKVNASRREVYRVEGGRYGRLGGREELLNIRVDVVY